MQPAAIYNVQEANLSAMKRFLPLIVLAGILFSACKSTKNYLERSDEDRALQDAVKRLSKNATDEDALTAVPVLYKSITATRLARIKSYQSGNDLGRWDKIISEYNQLQSAYTSIINNTAAFKLVTPDNYNTQLLESKQAAAEDYYNYAESFLIKNGRDNAKKAYSYFKKANGYMDGGYKDAQVKMNEAYENAIVDVVINPVQDNSFFINSGWGNSWNSYSNDYFQRALVRDLAYNNNSNNKNYAARFYSDWEAQKENIEADWEVNLILRNMEIPQPTRYSYRQNRTAKIETGKDTSGRPIYQTVSATVNLTRYSFTAYASMDVQIKDIVTPKSISNRSFREDYRWQEERGTYTGDSRALTSRDWEAINNRDYYEPRREQVVDELYKKLYNQILNHVRYSVEW